MRKDNLYKKQEKLNFNFCLNCTNFLNLSQIFF